MAVQSYLSIYRGIELSQVNKRNNLNYYDYREGVAFDGLMDKIASIVGTIGASKVNVHMHGADANGMDSLEVLDISKASETNIPEPGPDGDFLAADFNNDFYID